MAANKHDSKFRKDMEKAMALSINSINQQARVEEDAIIAKAMALSLGNNSPDSKFNADTAKAIELSKKFNSNAGKPSSNAKVTNTSSRKSAPKPAPSNRWEDYVQQLDKEQRVKEDSLVPAQKTENAKLLEAVLQLEKKLLSKMEQMPNKDELLRRYSPVKIGLADYLEKLKVEQRDKSEYRILIGEQAYLSAAIPGLRRDLNLYSSLVAISNTTAGSNVAGSSSDRKIVADRNSSSTIAGAAASSSRSLTLAQFEHHKKANLPASNSGAGDSKEKNEDAFDAFLGKLAVTAYGESGTKEVAADSMLAVVMDKFDLEAGEAMQKIKESIARSKSALGSNRTYS